eukprot:PhF_6_TR19944/c0_g1_i4/m.29028/K14549/UTP15; U3 small nucleolar RNA-associated protein 15
MERYKPLIPRNFSSATISPEDTIEKQKWQSYRELGSLTKYGHVVAIDYSPSEPHNCLAAWGNDMQAMGPLDNTEITFHASAAHGFHSARYRSDGKLAVFTVGDRGRVQVYDTSGNVIRTFNHHRQIAWGAAFTADKIHVASWSGDRSVLVCSLATEDVVYCAKQAHQDAVKCGDTHPVDKFIFATASSDREIRLWDQRSGNTPSMVLPIPGVAHTLRFAPLENLLVCGVASGAVLVFDPRAPEEPVFRLTPHSKAVTAMAFAENGTRLLTGSLDRCVKVLDTTKSYKQVCTLGHYACGVMSVGIAPNGAELAVGREDGTLVRYAADGVSILDDYLQDEPKRQHWARPTPVDATPKTKEPSYDYAMRSFSYKAALVNALKAVDHTSGGETLDAADAPYAVLEDLMRRNGLRVALAGWTEDEVYTLFTYLLPSLRHRNRTNVVITVLEIVNEIYCEELMKSHRLMTILKALHADLEVHLSNLMEMDSLCASLDIIMEPIPTVRATQE